jgi:hypothetical protein
VNLSELITALLHHEALSARQWVADAGRAGFDWSRVPRPTTSDPTELALTAGVVELLADRAGQQPPAWTGEVAAAPTTTFLVKGAQSMRRLRTLCEQEGPEPLRRRSFLAPPEFLVIA